MTASRANLLKQYKDTDKLHSKPVNMDTSGKRGGGGGGGGRKEGSVPGGGGGGGGGGVRGSKEVSVLGGLNIGKMQGLSFTRGNATGP